MPVDPASTSPDPTPAPAIAQHPACSRRLALARCGDHRSTCARRSIVLVSQHRTHCASASAGALCHSPVLTLHLPREGLGHGARHRDGRSAPTRARPIRSRQHPARARSRRARRPLRPPRIWSPCATREHRGCRSCLPSRASRRSTIDRVRARALRCPVAPALGRYDPRSPAYA